MDFIISFMEALFMSEKKAVALQFIGLENPLTPSQTQDLQRNLERAAASADTLTGIAVRPGSVTFSYQNGNQFRRAAYAFGARNIVHIAYTAKDRSKKPVAVQTFAADNLSTHSPALRKYDGVVAALESSGFIPKLPERRFRSRCREYDCDFCC